jgi:hypothetical protein
MPFTNEGAQFLTFRLGSSLEDLRVQCVGIGSGTSSATVTDSTLGKEHTRAMITGSPDFGDVRKIGFQGDFDSINLSGLDVTEFGLFASGTVNTGSAQLREVFSKITFDGTSELQVLSTIEILPG